MAKSGRTTLGHFRILDLLGVGGMGEVYRAEDLKLGREVALKVLPEDFSSDPARVLALAHEAKVLASLDHPNIGPLYDFQNVDGVCVLILKLIEGETLRGRVSQRPLRMDEALTVFLDVARGLDGAHTQQVVHRDLKPSNIKISDDGHATVLDFGIAKPILDSVDPDARNLPEGDVSGDDRETCFGAVLGTPWFMSPEQARGNGIDFQTDIWSFGCCFYFAITGVLPFPGESVSEVVASILEDEPDWNALPADTPREVRRLIHRCLRKNTAHRLSSARDICIVLMDEIEAQQSNAGETPWQPEIDARIPGRTNWILKRKLGDEGIGDAWLATHHQTGAARVFKFFKQSQRIDALKREVAVFHALREKLGHRTDIAQILDWQLDRAPYFIETEYTDTGDLRHWAEREGGLLNIPLDVRLEIVAQVADAISAAHSVGVIHQDIKPGNILISANPRSKVPHIIVTDFGLGWHMGDLESSETTAGKGAEADNAHSHAYLSAGSQLYAAPEIIEGRIVSTRSDVYAIGVLLYQVTVGDFAKSLAPGWERDVEDLLLRDDIRRCVEGAPERRFPNASIIGDHLRNLDRRRKQQEEASRQHELALRSHRRRRYLAALSAAAALTAFAFSFFAQHETERASRESSLRLYAEQKEIEALDSLDEVVRQRTIANENYRLARDAVDDALAKVSQSDLMLDPDLQPLRSELMQTSLEYYRTFIENERDEPFLRAELAWACFNASAIGMELEQPTWNADLDEGLDILEQLLHRETPASDLGPLIQGVWKPSAGTASRWPGPLRANPEAARKVYSRAIHVFEEAVEKYPESKGFKNDLAFAIFAYAHLLDDRPAQALDAHQRAMEIWKGLLDEDPGNADYQFAIALSYGRIANIYDGLGATDMGLRTHALCSNTFRSLLDASPKNDYYKENWGWHEFWRGLALYDAGDYDAALVAYNHSVDALSDLVQRNRNIPTLGRHLSRAYVRRGELRLARGERDLAMNDFRVAREVSDDAYGALSAAAWSLVTCPNHDDRDLNLALDYARTALTANPNNGRFRRTLGVVLYRLGDWEAAGESFRIASSAASEELERPRLRPEVDEGVAYFVFAMTELRLGHADKAKELYEIACKWMESNAPASEELSRYRVEADTLIGVNDPALAVRSSNASDAHGAYDLHESKLATRRVGSESH